MKILRIEWTRRPGRDDFRVRIVEQSCIDREFGQSGPFFITSGGVTLVSAGVIQNCLHNRLFYVRGTNPSQDLLWEEVSRQELPVLMDAVMDYDRFWAEGANLMRRDFIREVE